MRLFSIPAAAIQSAAHNPGGWGGGYIPHPPAGVTAPPAHGSSGSLVFLLVMAFLVAAPFVYGAVTAMRSPARARHAAPALGGYRPATAPGSRLPPEMTRGKPLRGSTRELRVAVTVFASPCDDCGAVRNQPCGLIPGRKTAVIDTGRNWVAHISRIARGARENKALYLDLLGVWQGEVPPELKGMY